jgi:hypothetical protein
VFGNIGAGKPITDLRDYNRDGAVTTTDAAVVFANIGNIVRISIAGGGPFAPDAEPAVAGDGSGSAVASALAAKAPPTVDSCPRPASVVQSLGRADFHGHRFAEYFRHLAEQETSRTRRGGFAVAGIEYAPELDEELLDSLVGARKLK